MEVRDGQGFEVGALFLEHLFDLALGATVDAFCRPVLLPVGKIVVLRYQRLEAPALERCGMATGSA